MPVLAITGTATRQMRSNIVKQLAMGENAVTINISPNRDNIRFTVFKTSKTDQLEYLGWLIEMVKKRTFFLQRLSFSAQQCTMLPKCLDFY